MSEEAQYIIDKLGLKECNKLPTKYPHRLFEKKTENYQLTLIENGRYAGAPDVSLIGTVAASVATHLVIQNLNPDLVINAGTAGGRKAMGEKIGDVLVASQVYFHDHRVSLPGYCEKFPGGFIAKSRSQKIAEKLKLPFVIMSSGNSFDMNDEDKKLIEAYQSRAKEMELAAIAWMCEVHEIEWMGIKAITDIIDDELKPSAEQFFANLKLACENLATIVEAALMTFDG